MDIELRGENKDGVGYKDSICGKGKSCGVDEHGVEMQVDHRVECAVIKWVLGMMVEAGTADCPKPEAMESFNTHVVNAQTNLQRVPQTSTAQGGGNGNWGSRMTGIRKVNSELLSQRPAGYYSTVLIKQGEAAVQLLEADSCANAPPWCRELLENVGGVFGKQMAYICNGISGVADCDKFRKMPKLQALVEKLDQTFDPTAKLIKDGIRNAGQVAQDVYAGNAEGRAADAGQAAKDAVKKAAKQAKKEMMEKTAAKAEKKLGETAGEEVMEQVAKKTTTTMTTAEEATMHQSPEKARKPATAVDTPPKQSLANPSKSIATPSKLPGATTPSTVSPKRLSNLAKGGLMAVGLVAADYVATETLGVSLDPVGDAVDTALDPATKPVSNAVGGAVQEAATGLLGNETAKIAGNTAADAADAGLKGTFLAALWEGLMLMIYGGATYTGASICAAFVWLLEIFLMTAGLVIALAIVGALLHFVGAGALVDSVGELCHLV